MNQLSHVLVVDDVKIEKISGLGKDQYNLVITQTQSDGSKAVAGIYRLSEHSLGVLERKSFHMIKQNNTKAEALLRSIDEQLTIANEFENS